MDTNEDEIIRSHVKFCAKFKVPTDDLVLPFFHLTPKFYERCLDFRYKSVAKKSSLKSLSQIMSKVLKLVDRTILFSGRYKFHYKDVSGYFIAKNKDKAIADLNYLNHSFHGRSIMSFD